MKLNHTLGLIAAVLLLGFILSIPEVPAEDKPADVEVKPSQSEDKAASAKEKPMYGEWGVETKNMSKTVSPGDDFYVYVNEVWLESSEIPQGFPRVDSFVVVHLRTEDQINNIMNDIKAGKTENLTGGEQVKALYESYMDEARIEELGLKPIQAEIDAIMKAETR